MGKKAITIILAIMSCYSSDMLGQTSPYNRIEKIKWQDNESLDIIAYHDTCLIRDSFEQEFGFESSSFFRSLTTDNGDYYIGFFPVGSGLPIWQVHIFKQCDDDWRLIAQGEACRRVFTFTTDYDAYNKRLLFYAMHGDYDRETNKIKNSIKEEIGVYYISDLKE